MSFKNWLISEMSWLQPSHAIYINGKRVLSMDMKFELYPEPDKQGYKYWMWSFSAPLPDGKFLNFYKGKLIVHPRPLDNPRTRLPDYWLEKAEIAYADETNEALGSGSVVADALRQNIYVFPMNTFRKTRFPDIPPTELLRRWKSKIDLIAKHAPRLPFPLSLKSLKEAEDALNDLIIHHAQWGGSLEPATRIKNVGPVKSQSDMLKAIEYEMSRPPIPSKQMSRLARAWDQFAKDFNEAYDLYKRGVIGNDAIQI